MRFGKNANQRYHTFRHIREAGLDVQAAELAIRADLLARDIFLTQGLTIGTVKLGTRVLRYSAFKLEDGVIHVDALRLTEDQTGRPLRFDERVLLAALLKCAGPPHPSLDAAHVVDLQDGGMGSIRFLASGPRQYARTLAEADGFDEDGVPVSIALHADEQGSLLELDLWKIDFSATRRYPSPSQLSIHPPRTHDSPPGFLSHSA